MTLAVPGVTRGRGCRAPPPLPHANLLYRSLRTRPFPSGAGLQACKRLRRQPRELLIPFLMRGRQARIRLKRIRACWRSAHWYGSTALAQSRTALLANGGIELHTPQPGMAPWPECRRCPHWDCLAFRASVMTLDGHHDSDCCSNDCRNRPKGQVEMPRRGVAGQKIVAQRLEQLSRARRMRELGPGDDCEREYGESLDGNPDPNCFPGLPPSLLKGGHGEMPGIRRCVCCHCV
ncbi:MAG: hypothetical protein JWN85_3819 [Gammaproteobacteria bacterium]|nr:hypothetical protein [Gammaproteobacteria bacterium]